jgi:hypothetical protein
VCGLNVWISGQASSRLARINCVAGPDMHSGSGGSVHKGRRGTVRLAQCSPLLLVDATNEACWHARAGELFSSPVLVLGGKMGLAPRGSCEAAGNPVPTAAVNPPSTQGALVMGCRDDQLYCLQLSSSAADG